MVSLRYPINAIFHLKTPHPARHQLFFVVWRVAGNLPAQDPLPHTPFTLAQAVFVCCHEYY